MNILRNRPQASGAAKKARRRGFTLIEILIAITIFSLVMAAIYSTWVMIMRASRVSQEAMAQAQRERVALHTIENSLTCIQSIQASLQYYSFYVVNGDQPVLSFTARLPQDFPRSVRFDSPLRRVTYSVEPVANPISHTSENDLVLRQNSVLTGLDPEEQARPYILARNVQAFKVECIDTNLGVWTEEWDDTNSIPRALRVTLVLGKKAPNANQPEGPVMTLTSVLDVPSQTLPVQMQIPGRGGGGGSGSGGGGGGGGGGNKGGGNKNNNGNKGNNGNTGGKVLQY